MTNEGHRRARTKGNLTATITREQPLFPGHAFLKGEIGNLAVTKKWKTGKAEAHEETNRWINIRQDSRLRLEEEKEDYIYYAKLCSS